MMCRKLGPRREGSGLVMYNELVMFVCLSVLVFVCRLAGPSFWPQGCIEKLLTAEASARHIIVVSMRPSVYDIGAEPIFENVADPIRISLADIAALLDSLYWPRSLSFPLPCAEA